MKKNTRYPGLELGDNALATEQRGCFRLLNLHLQLFDLLLKRLAHRVDLHAVLLLLVQHVLRALRIRL